MAAMHATAMLLEETLKTRVINPNLVKKHSQLLLVLVDFKNNDHKRFRRNLRVSPSTFDELVIRIQDHDVFKNDSHVRQFPVEVQLAVALFRFGHEGNAASVSAIAQWAGISEGTVVNYTRHVIIAFLALHDTTVRWPSEEDKEEAKRWVESVSCVAWRDGFCMGDGTLVSIFEKPGYHGEAYFDRKGGYSLNLQVSFLTSLPHPKSHRIAVSDPSEPPRNRLCCWSLRQCARFHCHPRLSYIQKAHGTLQGRRVHVGRLCVRPGFMVHYPIQTAVVRRTR